jgi:hypothetical protein
MRDKLDRQTLEMFDFRSMVHGRPLDTEVEAALSLLPNLSQLRMRVYLAFINEPEGLTDSEVESRSEFSGLAPSTVRKRRSELYHLGALRAVGKRKNTVHQNGRNMTVWAISPHDYREPK